MFKLLLATTTSCILAASLSAQGASYFIPDNVATTGGCNVIPFGTQKTSTTWANQVYQTMATAADLGNASVVEICDLAFARCTVGSKSTNFDFIEIKLAQTSATSLSTTFATNLVANVKTVLSAKNYEWHTEGNAWNRIGLDSSYTYIAGLGVNLVVQITTMGCDQIGTTGFRTGARQRLYNFGWSGSAPTTGTVGSSAALKWEIVSQKADLHTFGHGCKGTNGVPALSFTGSAALGSNFSVDVANCVNNTVALHVFGLTRYPGGIDLGFAGAPGCILYETPDIILGAVADSTGKYSMKLTVPKDRNLICLRIYTQAFPADTAANSWGRTASNYGRILPGY